MKTPKTILAIDPGLRDLGHAVLRGRRILDSGVATFRFVPRRRRHLEALSAVRTWIGRYDPDALVIEATTGDSQPPFPALRRLERSLKGLASRHHLACALYPAQTARKTLLGNGWAGKRDVAVALAARYPTLRIYVRQNRQWKERYFQNMFDAVALALHHQAHSA
ncbi:MAG: crossover junction endodeoxyribonuclease RuvC [Salinibacterium sp.]|nr:crossover junction endodeoxyribonuclease RuvC [Salinibacterium sp.]